PRRRWRSRPSAWWEIPCGCDGCPCELRGSSSANLPMPLSAQPHLGRSNCCPHCPACTGGHGTEPYEQNTQQSPGFGLRRSPQPCRGTAVVARPRNLCSTARIENVKDRAIRNRLTGTLLDSFGQQTFEFFKVGNFGTHIL